MRKVILLVVCLVAVLAWGSAVDVSAATDQKKATITRSEVLVDGEYVHMTGFNIDGLNYYKLRDVAVHLAGTSSEFDVLWNSKERAIEIKQSEAYIGDMSDEYYYYNTTRNAVLSSSKLVVDGQLATPKIYNIDNSSYFQLRDLGRLVGFDVKYVADQNQIRITSQSPLNAYKVAATKELISNKLSFYSTRWKNTVDTYLYANEDQTISTLEVDQHINVLTYDANYRLLSSFTVDYELPLFGAFYSGKEYNYIAFGQANNEENDHKEVIRIVKYDKQFKRLASASIQGGASYTVIPFDAAAARFAEQGDKLILHTARKRYLTPDGSNHQSQLTLIVDTNTMKVTNDTGQFQSNHVSHSFDQYVLFDGSQHMLLDHGDAYPRSIVLHQGDGNNYVERDIVRIPGAIGANATGVSIGGFELASTSFLVAYNTIDHSKAKRYTSFDIEGTDMHQRDIMVAVVPRDDVVNGKIKQVRLERYVGTKQRASVPQLVKISDNKFLVQWQVFAIEDEQRDNGTLKYMYIDNEGNTLSSVQELKYFQQSTVQPIVHQNKVIWYTNHNNQRTFYTVPLQ